MLVKNFLIGNIARILGKTSYTPRTERDLEGVTKQRHSAIIKYLGFFVMATALFIAGVSHLIYLEDANIPGYIARGVLVLIALGAGAQILARFYWGFLIDGEDCITVRTLLQPVTIRHEDIMDVKLNFDHGARILHITSSPYGFLLSGFFPIPQEPDTGRDWQEIKVDLKNYRAPHLLNFVLAKADAELPLEEAEPLFAALLPELGYK